MNGAINIWLGIFVTIILRYWAINSGVTASFSAFVHLWPGTNSLLCTQAMSGRVASWYGLRLLFAMVGVAGAHADTSKQLYFAEVIGFFFWSVLLIKDKVVPTTLYMTYVVKIWLKTRSISCFWGREFEFLCRYVLFPQGNYNTSRIFGLKQLNPYGRRYATIVLIKLRASLITFPNFVRWQRLIARNLAELFISNCGISFLHEACRIDEMSRGSVLG